MRYYGQELSLAELTLVLATFQQSNWRLLHGLNLALVFVMSGLHELCLLKNCQKQND